MDAQQKSIIVAAFRDAKTGEQRALRLTQVPYFNRLTSLRFMPGLINMKGKDMLKRGVRTPIMHRFVEYNGAVHFGGLVADDLSQPMGGQTSQICKKLDKLLAEAGTDKTKLLSAMIYVTDLSLKQEMNNAWTNWIDSEDLPTRATIGVSDLGKGVLIEIVATAALWKKSEIPVNVIMRVEEQKSIGLLKERHRPWVAYLALAATAQCRKNRMTNSGRSA